MFEIKTGADYFSGEMFFVLRKMEYGISNEEEVLSKLYSASVIAV